MDVFLSWNKLSEDRFFILMTDGMPVPDKQVESDVGVVAFQQKTNSRDVPSLGRTPHGV